MFLERIISASYIQWRRDPTLDHSVMGSKSYRAKASGPRRRNGVIFRFAADSDLEAEALHAAPVLLDRCLAVLGRILGVREEHALVAPRLFVLADATRPGLLGLAG